MATKIRLTRLGKKKQPTYRVVVMDSRKPRDGKYIEQLGIYDPRQQPSLIKIDNERALHWLHTGAQPTERAQKLLEISGAWTQFKVAKGDIHTIADAPETVEEPVADAVPEQEESVVEAAAVEASDDDGSQTTDDGPAEAPEAEAEVAEEEVITDESSEEA
jgi:small subunit ribosomal protein S16